MLPSVTITCAFCFQRFDLGIDPGEADASDFVVDCEICCRPMLVQLFWEDGEPVATAVAESD